MLTRHRFKTLLLMLTSLALSQGSYAQPFQTWVPLGDGRVDETEGQKVLIDHGGLVSALSAADDNMTPAALSFLVEKEVFVCNLRPSALMAPGLQRKFPLLKVYAGSCSNEWSVTLVVNQAELDSISTTIYTNRGVFYVDHSKEEENSQVYTLIKKSDIPPGPNHEQWKDQVIQYKGDGDRLRRLLLSHNSTSPRNLQTSSAAFTYRLAMITTRQYSLEYDNTRAGVLQGIVTGMARVNGIFLRELGVMFELIDSSDDLICLDGDADCTDLDNNDPSTYINQVEGFIQARGVPVSAYDLGHGLATNAGGLAVLGALCGSYKAEGMTGLSNPRGDVFWVDYVSHEVRTQTQSNTQDCWKFSKASSGTLHSCAFNSIHRLATSF